VRARAGLSAIAVLLSARAVAAEPPLADPFPKAAAAYLVAIDGRVTWAHDPDGRRPPASLTKIMTALVLLDKAWTPSAVGTVSPRSSSASGSRLGLKAGQRMTAGDLFTAMLVRSANDACLALAEHAAGSVETFVTRMNAQATTLGLSATRFTNPCGLDDPEHRSSARDLFRLAQAALSHKPFADTVALEHAEVRTLDGSRFSLSSSNALLGRLPGALGVKTGYTHAAGKCVIAAAQRDRVRVVVVLLDAPDRWWAAAGLIEKAFESVGAQR
jgi:serine-type D-Ala-D-Ala carboxypeptidase (penicillin-binding protein 5/6)